ncbi:hypothetical protein [Phenylobacterium sp.]|uniref:hypothetical protein n=1 Tax=Phenylobacterium sp. TaxID=1871053 RepID=UPI000C890A65|nr:hypothetical protein [Phenylobacterium sp.]MAK80259.1 hypothetical protein [Phenylobacterium sp.]
MKIKIEIKQVKVETHVAEIDLSDPYDKECFGTYFDLYGNFFPDAENDPYFFQNMRDQDRLELAGVERQSEYVWDCEVVSETEAA